jgi:2-hydroxy-3-oxopropionate reductase
MASVGFIGLDIMGAPMAQHLINTATAQELFSACVAHGGVAWDHGAMVRALEALANFEIGQEPPPR